MMRLIFLMGLVHLLNYQANGQKIWTSYDTSDGLGGLWVKCIFEDQANNIWVSTWNHGVSKFDGTNWTVFDENDGLLHNDVFTIGKNQDGDLLFGCYNGVSKFNGTDTWEVINSNNSGLTDGLVQVIFTDRQGHTWFGTNSGLSYFDGTDWTSYTTADGLHDDNIDGITEDINGNIWVCHGTSSSSSVSMFDGTSWTSVTHTIFNFKQTVSICADKKGNVWFGLFSFSGAAGVVKYDGTNWHKYTMVQGMAGNDVYSVFEDSDSNVWFGHIICSGSEDGPGVTKFDGTSFTTYTTTDGLGNGAVTCIYEDRSGTIWFGTNGGVTSMRNASGTGPVSKDRKLRLYPNPSTDCLTIQNVAEEVDYLIYSNMGKLIEKGKTSGRTMIQIGNLRPGQYFIQLDGYGTYPFLKK